MTERILPAPDIFVTCCPADTQILEYYAGVFEAVFVQFHPFLRAVSISTDQFRPGTYPNRSAIVRGCAPVAWSEVASRAGLPSIAAVDVGLRTQILGLRKDLLNQEWAKRLDALVASDQILPPDEGRFSDLNHDRTLSAIQSLGYNWVWVGDEFGTERKLHWIEELKLEDKDSKATRGHCNVFTPDKQLLWTTDWDSHFSLLCASKRSLLPIQETYAFEGFFCTPLTEVYWSVQAESPTP